MKQMIRYYDAELNRAYEEAVMTIAICRDIRNSTYYKIDYIQELEKLKNKAISYFDSHDSVVEYVESMDKKYYMLI